MQRARRILWLPTAVLAALAAAYGVASLDWCARPAEAVPSLLGSGAAEGTLHAGAAQVDLSPPLPAVVAGYPPRRPDASGIHFPLRVRALVLQVEQMRLGLVSVDLLTIPESLAAEVRRAVADLKLAHVWVTATHAHSSFGGYDQSLLAQFAGTGRYRDSMRAAVERGAIEALQRAAASLAPAELEIGEGTFPLLVAPRSEGLQPDGRLTRLVIKRSPDGSPLAQWIIFAAHPTLVPRPSQMLAPDYPGLFAAAQEKAGAGITLVTQGAVGNAVASVEFDDPSQAPDRFAGELAKATAEVSLAPTSPMRLAFTRVAVSLPQADASRLVPRLWRGAADNLLCLAAPSKAELSALQLGPLKLLVLPGEPTPGAAELLRRESGAQTVMALTDGYIGYVEVPELLALGIGESKRQYFRAELLAQLARAAHFACDKLGFKQRAAR